MNLNPDEKRAFNEELNQYAKNYYAGLTPEKKKKYIEEAKRKQTLLKILVISMFVLPAIVFFAVAIWIVSTEERMTFMILGLAMAVVMIIVALCVKVNDNWIMIVVIEKVKPSFVKMYEQRKMYRISPKAQLRELQDMYQDGLISSREYEAKRRDILNL